MVALPTPSAAQHQADDLCQALAAAKLSRVDDPGVNAYFGTDGVWTVVCAPTADNPQVIAQRLNRAGWWLRMFSARIVSTNGVRKVAQIVVRLEQAR